MKWFYKGIALLAIVAMLFSVTGCGGEKPIPSDDGGATVATEPVSEQATDFPEALTLNKVCDLKAGVEYTTTEGGLYYSAEDKFGLTTFDGKADTGLKYTSLKPVGRYFAVTTSEAEINPQDYATLNVFGLVDVNGKELVPQQYASIRMEGDRFAYCASVSGKAPSKEEALVYYSDDMISLSADEDDLLFSGEWCVYDVFTGKKLEGVSGIAPTTMTTYGDQYLEYRGEDGTYVTVDANGKPFEVEDADLLGSGGYAVEDDTNITVYAPGGEEAFKLASAAWSSLFYDDGYYVARSDESNTYAVMDDKGNVLFDGFTSIPSFYGEFVRCDGYIYRLDGTKLIEDEVSAFFYDAVPGYAWVVETETDEEIVLNNKGTVLYRAPKSDDVTMGITNCFPTKKIGEQVFSYSFKDSDFTIQGRSVAPFLCASTNSDYTYSLVDVISGKELLSSYDACCYEIGADGMYYLVVRVGETQTVYTVC